MFAPLAVGDGDPASDVLLVQNAFYPYMPRVPAGLETELNRLLDIAKAEHFPLRVAIIGSREDLGAVPTFFGTPQKYAEFLELEISFNTKRPLLVVMPGGFGLADVGPAASIAGVRVGEHAGPAELARAAIAGVRGLARANGRGLTAKVSAGGGSGGRGSPGALLFGVPVLLLVLAGVVVALRGRRRPETR